MLLEEYTILYVEDDINSLNNLSLILENYCKKVYKASDGKDALALYSICKPDIILTDVYMPNMNGLELIHEIKKINPKQHTIILTALSDENILKDAIDLGIDKFMNKPVTNINILLEKLESIAITIDMKRKYKNTKKISDINSKLAGITEMASNISHQWRQPLSIISGYASSLNLKIDLEEDLKKEDLKNIANNIIIQTEYLSKTLDDFRNLFSQDYSIIQKFDLKDAVHEVIQMLEDEFSKYNINIINNINNIFVKQNKNQMVQVFINILKNSIDALCKVEKDSRIIIIDNCEDENYFYINITDSGDGIKEDNLDKIYEPYFTTKHKYIGTGLGLFIVKKVMQNNFLGEININNKEFEFNTKKLTGTFVELSISKKLTCIE